MSDHRRAMQIITSYIGELEAALGPNYGSGELAHSAIQNKISTCREIQARLTDDQNQRAPQYAQR